MSSSKLTFPPLNQQTVFTFSAGVLTSLLILYLPTLLRPPLPFLRSLLFLAYVLLTHALAFLLFLHRKSLPSPHRFTSLQPHSPWRYSYLLLAGSLLLLQLLWSEAIAERVWAPIVLYVGQLLVHAPFVVYAFSRMVKAAGGGRWEEGGWVWWGMMVPAVLVLVGCGALFTVSEVALSRKNPSLAWPVLREILELAYALLMLTPILDEPGGQAGWWMAAYAGRNALWAVLAVVSQRVARGVR